LYMDEASCNVLGFSTATSSEARKMHEGCDMLCKRRTASLVYTGCVHATTAVVSAACSALRKAVLGHAEALYMSLAQSIRGAGIQVYYKSMAWALQGLPQSRPSTSSQPEQQQTTVCATMRSTPRSDAGGNMNVPCQARELAGVKRISVMTFEQIAAKSAAPQTLHVIETGAQHPDSACQAPAHTLCFTLAKLKEQMRWKG